MEPPGIAWLEALKLEEEWTVPKVTKTAACELFRLPAKQLEGLEYVKQRNRHGPYPMRLYSREAVYQVALDYHRSKLERAAARPQPKQRAPQTSADRAKLLACFEKPVPAGSQLLPVDLAGTLTWHLLHLHAKAQKRRPGSNALSLATAAIALTGKDLANLARASKACYNFVVGCWPTLDAVAARELYTGDRALPKEPAVAWDDLVAGVDGAPGVCKAWSATDIKQACKALQLPVTGAKADLRQRVLERFGLQRPSPVPARLLYMLHVRRNPPPAPKTRKRKSKHPLGWYYDDEPPWGHGSSDWDKGCQCLSCCNQWQGYEEEEEAEEHE